MNDLVQWLGVQLDADERCERINTRMPFGL